MTALVVSASIVLLVLAAWLRVAGTAITRVPRADALRDASDGVSGAATVAELLDNRAIISPAVGVVASGLLLVGASLSTAVFANDAASGSSLLIAVAVGVLFFLLGDLVPRWLGRLRPRRLAYMSHRVLGLAVGLAAVLVVTTNPE